MEKKIKDNLPFFNDHEPDEGHEARFINRLNERSARKPGKINFRLVFKIAAALILLVATSYLALKTISTNKSHDLLITQIEYNEELSTVQSYYDDLTETLLNQIDNLANSEKEAERLKTKAYSEINKLDANLAMIEKEYIKNPQCERVKAAIVSNKKMKADVVENIVDQLDNAQRGYHAGRMFTNY